MNIDIRKWFFQYRYEWLVWPAYILFFMMLFVPTTYQPIKAILLAIILMMICIALLRHGTVHLHMDILRWTLFMMCIGLVFIVVGVLNNAPGALRVSTVYVLWPFVYMLLIAGISSKKIIDGLFKVMVFSMIIISLYTILFLLHAIGWLPEFLYLKLDMGQAIGIYKGYIEYRLYNISSLNFLVPFLIAMVLIWPVNKDTSVFRLWLWIACFLGIVIAILSGRRAVWLILAISPLIVIIARMFMARQFRVATSRKFWRLVTGLSMMVGTLFFFGTLVAGLDVVMIWGQLVAGFKFSGGGVGESLRAEQFFALLDAWQKNPFFGAGHGASASASIRSIDMPWAYELSYVALLFQTGLIGFLFYSVGVIWIFWMSLKIMHSDHWLNVYMLPVFVGTVCFLIANATNPYLAKFDYIWVIFLPVGLINIWLLDTGNINNSEKKL
ncbi:MAG: hypothetical protein L3J70_07630 [Gammaproteobacteria bacterium]|nr:hypothetical protein [Gammaproteobacteria bacterium]